MPPAPVPPVRSLPLPVPTADGVLDAHLFVPADAPTGDAAPPAVIFYMDALSIRPALVQMAERLAGLGYGVLLPNLYYRLGAVGSFPAFDSARVRAEPAERDRMFGMMKTLSHERIMADTRAMLAVLDQRPEVYPYRVGCVGYCMGGGFSLSAAGTCPHRILAAASFHGGGLATDAMDSPHLLAPKIKAKLHIGVAELDNQFSADQGERLKTALREARCDFVYEVYPGAKHGYAVTGHTMYDPAMSERHWERLAHLLATLRTANPQ